MSNPSRPPEAMFSGDTALVLERLDRIEGILLRLLLALGAEDDADGPLASLEDGSISGRERDQSQSLG